MKLALVLAVGTAVAVPAAAQTRTTPAPADVAFFSGMISHHAQAILISGWAGSHGASPSIRTLCERIVVAQRDEIAAMQRWLGTHGQDTASAMHHAMAMPGMLSPAQLAELDRATGARFDSLFLTFMIQHHRGALQMVNELVNANAARDGLVFQIASDIGADQSAEIARMTRMLDALTQTQRSPP